MRCTSLVPTCLLVVAACAQIASAQDSSDTSTAGAPQLPLAIWGSLGVGPGNVTGSSTGGVAGVVRANVSLGRWLLSYRDTDVGPFLGSGDGVRDGAMLAGIRTGGHRLFASATLGYGTASHYSRRGENTPEVVEPRIGALAYDAVMHANYRILGLALGFSGNVAPARVAYSAVTVALELGWFGR